MSKKEFEKMYFFGRLREDCMGTEAKPVIQVKNLYKVYRVATATYARLTE